MSRLLHAAVRDAAWSGWSHPAGPDPIRARLTGALSEVLQAPPVDGIDARVFHYETEWPPSDAAWSRCALAWWNVAWSARRAPGG